MRNQQNNVLHEMYYNTSVLIFCYFGGFMNNISSKHCCGIFKEAWQKLKGMKQSFWGGALLVILVTTGGVSVLTSLLFLSKLAFAPHLMQHFQMHPEFLLGTLFAIPTGLAVSLVVYHIAQALLEAFLLLPMRMGLRLIPLRQIAGKSVHSLFVFKYLTWKYIWRFVALSVLVIIAIGVPGAIGAVLLCLPGPHYLMLGLTLKIICYVIGIAFLLYALYLAVCFTFVNLLVIDRDISAWNAMKLSREVISKRWFCVFGTLVFIGVVLAIATLLLTIGLFWAAPYAQNVIAILYRDMLGIEGKDPVSLEEIH